MCVLSGNVRGSEKRLYRYAGRLRVYLVVPVKGVALRRDFYCCFKIKMSVTSELVCVFTIEKDNSLSEKYILVKKTSFYQNIIRY